MGGYTLYFSSKFTEDEIKEIAKTNPPDLKRELVDIKDAQLRRLCDEIEQREYKRPMCVMTKVRDRSDLSLCRFYFTLEELLVKEYNSGADFKLTRRRRKGIGYMELLYSNARVVDVFPFSSYGLAMYRIMRHGIINTDPELKNKYIFERVWENRFSYLLKSDYLAMGLTPIIQEKKPLNSSELVNNHGEES